MPTSAKKPIGTAAKIMSTPNNIKESRGFLIAKIIKPMKISSGTRRSLLTDIKAL
jgi:hypothetical protein